jgi:hypothetical protein
MWERPLNAGKSDLDGSARAVDRSALGWSRGKAFRARIASKAKRRMHKKGGILHSEFIRRTYNMLRNKSFERFMESKHRENPCCLESHLINFLHRYVVREQDKACNIYDAAWALFALKYINRMHKQLRNEVRQMLLPLERMSSDELSGFLYDYRRAVGIALSIYLIGKKNHKLPMNEIFNILIENAENSEIGELTGVTFLLLNHFKNEELKEKITKLMNKIKEMGFNEPEYRLADTMYVAFFTAMVNDKFYIEILKNIMKNEYLFEEYIVNDPEKLTLFLYILSKAIDLNEDSLVDWCKEKREEAAKSLQQFVDEISSTLGSHFSTGGMRSSVNAPMQYDLEKERYIEELPSAEAIPFFIRPDLVSKTVIALYEAGYLKPFTLSKKEADTYWQIQAELKRYRRVRKYELIFILISFYLFILILPFLHYIVTTMHINVIQVIYAYFNVYKEINVILIPILILICGSIWEYGYISREILKLIVEKYLKRCNICMFY